MDETQKVYLMKHGDSSVFGPVSFTQVRQWAIDAQVSPLDKISTDQNNWIKAPMIPELEMDYLVEVSPDQYYGPTTLGAVREFLVMGEINRDTTITNCKDGSTQTVREIPFLKVPTEEDQPVRSSVRVSLQQRIRDLEESLLDERRAREAAEQLVERLEARVAELKAQIKAAY
jgi:peptidoglycan hydrolase-like protein with peptidoglycan-binding domain